jgi:predicted secreted protein
MMSLYFMNAKATFKEALNEEGIVESSLVMDHLGTFFENDDPNGWKVVNWFDKTFHPEVGINVYDYEFNYDKGYVVIESEEYQIILLKL